MADTNLAAFQPHEIARLSLQMAEQLRPSLRRMRISSSEWLALTALCDGAEWRVSILSKHCGVQQPTMSKALHNLASGGFITKREDPQDARVVLTAATPKGKAMGKQLMADWPQSAGRVAAE